MASRRFRTMAVLMAGLLWSGPGPGVSRVWAQAVAAAGQSAASPTQNPPVFGVTVIETAPLPGVGLPLEKIPAPVQTATAVDIDESGALDLSAFLNSRLPSVHVNEIQNNPFQADVNYRGYTASPLLGTPQGLSVYMDGVRLNQPFGDTVSWDLIPRMAIASTTLMPGSNPLFGLNTLGGALALQTKSGRTTRGGRLMASYGSNVRRMFEVEHGGVKESTGLDWYVAGSLFGEDGWRTDSPSDVRQLFAKLGWQRDTTGLVLTAIHADNALTGNGLQEQTFLAGDRSSVYTKPDTTDNRSTFLALSGHRSVSPRASITGSSYYRRIRTNTLNGDINEESLDQSLYLPGENPTNTPFPSLRCIENALDRDEPAEKCNGLTNTSNTLQHNAGLNGQYTRRDPAGPHVNQFTMGGGYDRSRVAFVQASELGYLNPDRSVTGVGAFGDGETGGEVDGEPYETRVDLDGTISTWSLYGADTLSLGAKWNLTLSGRFNRTTIDNRDRIQPGGGPGSLDGRHVFSRFNPAAGVTFTPASNVNLYAGYSEGSRAATSVELGCADPEEPCKLPNAMAGDPPLNQVVARTWDAGARGTLSTLGPLTNLQWNMGVFRATNQNDILFVISGQTGFGYFRNFGETRRQGIEFGVSRQVSSVRLGGGYTFLSATYQSEETVNGESNSSNDESEEGEKGLDGVIAIVPGNRIPLIPRHMYKAFADVQVTRTFAIDVNVIALSSSPARGNENGGHEPDDIYYLGPGQAAGYGLVNLGARLQLRPNVQLIGQINNLFNTDYASAAQLGPTGFTNSGQFIARPFPGVGGEFPVRHSTFFAPGAPIRSWIGLQLTF